MDMILVLFILYLTSLSNEAIDQVTGSSDDTQSPNVQSPGNQSSNDQSPDDQSTDDELPEEVLNTGVPCSTETYPFMVMITVLNDNVLVKKGCAGTLIDSRHVLTAASCLSLNYTLMVVAGIDNPEGFSEMRIVKKQIPHSNSQTDIYKTDIAILVLEEPIHTNDHIQYAVLPPENNNYSVIKTLCKNGISLSWGHTVYEEENSTLSDVSELNCAQLRIVSPEECKTMSPVRRVHEESVCTLSLECQGDKGGPILCNGKQLAVISWTSGCSNHFLEVHTRVDKTLDFIRAFLRDTRSRGVSIFTTIWITKWFSLVALIFKYLNCL